MNKNYYDFIVSRKHHSFRKEWKEYQTMAEDFSKEQLDPIERMTRRFEQMTKLEEPVILEYQQICFLRTVSKIPDCFTEAEWKEIRKTHFIHELGYMSNLSPDYERVIQKGLLAIREEADEYGKREIDALIALADRYREKAQQENRPDIAQTLEQVPRYGARNLREALQMFRIVHYALWLEGNYHNTVGRFDQYIYPYYRQDIKAGIHTKETALELMEDFFLSFNIDSDLYTGVQQGDNGQSMVLGGTNSKGEDLFNEVSELCLRASDNLRLIDPKINLRVNKNTPLSIYELGTKLTKAGLGFPQYSNDDVVIEGLEKLGYDREDACNYVVAACWEFIIPKVGADVANIGALSFPKAIDVCLHRDLNSCDTYADFEASVKKEIQKEAGEICDHIKDLWFVPSPFMNALYEGGIYDGAKYNNFGIHGTGIATAADSLAAIEKYIYQEKTITKSQLIEAVDSDFAEHSEILPILRYEAPKCGNDDDFADKNLSVLLSAFSDALKGRKNCRGGVYRAGTGSAMYYLWHANELGASPDGRRKGEPFGTNFSPSLFAKINGPLSDIISFTKPELKDCINGGPLTMEFAASVFQSEDSIRKVAALVKEFIDLGGHQLQLNTVNLSTMKDAQAHPELHRQLVVRIWGWSAYFVELDKEYQDHVMKRQEYAV